MAGTGWLMITGGLGLAVDRPLSLELFQANLMVQWLPAVIFGVVLFVAGQRARNPLVVPGLIVGGVILFYPFVGLLNIPIDQSGALKAGC